VMYRVQLIVYACVHRICISLQQAPAVVQRKKNDSWDNDDQHWLNNVLEQPTPTLSWNDYIWHVASHLLLTGHTYIWKWRNGLHQVSEMWPVPTSWVTPRYDAQGRLSHYSVHQGAGRSVDVLPRDMIRCVFPDPSNLTGGLGPLQAALRDTQTDEARADYIIEMLENNRSPGMIIKQLYPWSPEEKDDVRAALNQGLGRGRRGNPLFVSGEGAAIEQSAPLSDLDWPGISNLSETRICAAFGVPPIIIGLRAGLEHGTYSNFEQAIKVFFEGTVAPLWSMLGVTFTRGLLRDEGESNRAIRVHHDTKDVKALQEDQDKKIDRANKAFSGGLVDLDVARSWIGEGPLPNGEGKFRVLPMGLMPTGPAAPDETPDKDDGTANGDEGDESV
jgi:HK97 family phage portal protein